MTLEAFLGKLRECRLIASVQASEGSPVDHPEILLKLAEASIQEGVQILRLQGLENIRVIRAATRKPVIGLIKRSYPGSDIYITPTGAEVNALIDTGCEVIALDGTPRRRPNGENLKDLVALIHANGRLAMADCDCEVSARYAVEAGADLVGTTLGGYTDARPATEGPDLDLLRECLAHGVPAIAEGRYYERWQVESALRIGAAAVVVGGAINDPVKQTRSLKPRAPFNGDVGAVDIGGTWLRFGRFNSAWELLESDRVPNPKTREERLEWIRSIAERFRVEALGVSTGGIVDPATGICWTAKSHLMPDHVGIAFSESTLGLPTSAHGDGHATAWGHACLPQFAGKRVATIALGTGVGCGFVQDGKIWAGRRGEYPRLNDLWTANGTFESVLGGINLTSNPGEKEMSIARSALHDALFAIRNLYFPDEVVVGGSVGLSDWLLPDVERGGAIPSPFGVDAGLYGAAALVLFPPR